MFSSLHHFLLQILFHWWSLLTVIDRKLTEGEDMQQRCQSLESERWQSSNLCCFTSLFQPWSIHLQQSTRLIRDTLTHSFSNCNLVLFQIFFSICLESSQYPSFKTGQKFKYWLQMGLEMDKVIVYNLIISKNSKKGEKKHKKFCLV